MSNRISGKRIKGLQRLTSLIYGGLPGESTTSLLKPRGLRISHEKHSRTSIEIYRVDRADFSANLVRNPNHKFYIAKSYRPRRRQFMG